MAFLSEADKERIKEAVVAAEARTTAEFVTVIAGASGHYLFVPTLVAGTAVLGLSGLALALPVRISVTWYYAAQVIGFVVLSLVFRWPPIKFRLTPRSVQRHHAHRRARQLFLDLGLSSTKNRTGILLFVSIAERYVEIIGDRGVHEHLGEAFWQKIISDFTQSVRRGRIADGFIGAIEACATAAAEHHPWQPDDQNELPNELIELP